MTWYTDDRRLYWEQRRLDFEQAQALGKMRDQAAREMAEYDGAVYAELSETAKGIIDQKLGL